MVSKPSLWLFLGSPVFIGIILDSQLLRPLQLLLQPFAVKPLMRFSHRLWFRTYSRRHSESWDHCQTVTAVILAPIVFLQVPLRSSSADLPYRGNLTIIGAATRPHMPPKDSAQKLTRFTRLQDPSRTSTCQVSPADVSLRWRHHFHVICWRHSPAANVIVDHGVDFDRWLFSNVDFFSPGSSYPVFRVDFIFAVCFCILCL